MDINKEQILVVDDEEDLRKAIVDILTLDGFEVDQAGSAEEAAEKLSQTAYDVLITDHNLPQKTGVELLEESLVRYPEIIGIVITGYGTIETAVNAIKKGAYNYLTKPFKLVELPIMVRKGLKERHLRFENQYLRKQLDERYGFDNIIGTGRAMKRIFELVDTIAGLTSTVLIQGETGTGKELIAKAIHFNSQRKDQKLVSINCGAIPENLLESELFGHVKGAFTGAVQTRIGRFEQANGGTIFLDEIGNMPMSLQVQQFRSEFLVTVRPAQALKNELPLHIGHDILEIDAFFRDLNQRHKIQGIAVLDLGGQVRRQDRGPPSGEGHHPFDDVL